MKHLILLTTRNMMNIKGVLLQCFINFSIKKTYGCAIKSKIVSNQELALELLHKSMIRTFEKRKTHSSLIDNIWSADLTDM